MAGGTALVLLYFCHCHETSFPQRDVTLPSSLGPRMRQMEQNKCLLLYVTMILWLPAIMQQKLTESQYFKNPNNQD